MKANVPVRLWIHAARLDVSEEGAQKGAELAAKVDALIDECDEYLRTYITPVIETLRKRGEL